MDYPDIGKKKQQPGGDNTLGMMAFQGFGLPWPSKPVGGKGKGAKAIGMKGRSMRGKGKSKKMKSMY